MPTIVNPYRINASPVGDAIKRIGESMFGDTLTPALKREKLYAEQRGNVETENLMRAVNNNSDLDWAQLAPAMIGAGYDPQKFNELNRGRSAALWGTRDPRTQAAQIGAGSPFSATAEAFDMGDATDRRGQDIASGDRRYGVDVGARTDLEKFYATPVEAMVGDQPVFVPRSGAFNEGVAPVLSQSERGPASEFNDFESLYLGQMAVDPNNPSPEEMKQAKDYALAQVSKSKGRTISVGADGVTIEEGGIGGLTNNVQSNLQKQTIESEQFNQLSGMAQEYLTDPANANLFGVTGRLRQLGQGAVEAANNFALTAGYQSEQDMVAALRDEAAQAGVASLLPEIYDPGLDAVDTIWGMIVYKGAAALAGQEGRSVSDKDIAMFRDIFGDPKALFSSQKSLAAKLAVADRIVNANQSVRDRAMRGDSLRGDKTAPPPATLGQGTTMENPVPVASEEEIQSLPVGTFVLFNGEVMKVAPYE